MLDGKLVHPAGYLRFYNIFQIGQIAAGTFNQQAKWRSSWPSLLDQPGFNSFMGSLVTSTAL